MAFEIYDDVLVDFDEEDDLTVVVVPDTVKRIGKNAFGGSHHLMKRAGQ